MKFKSDSQRRAVMAKLNKFSNDLSGYTVYSSFPSKDLIEEEKMLIFKLNNPPRDISKDEAAAIVRRLDIIDMQLRGRNEPSQDAGGGFANAVVSLWPDREHFHRGVAGNKIADAVVGLWPGEPRQEIDQFGNIIHRRSVGDSFSDAITGLWPG